ncbi:MAG: hypothetical protein QHH24_00340 [Candidatus Bathyarchaeota archaeon]|nr:hypothetical protein [Candidatus Bathyarchaeota archaeon]
MDRVDMVIWILPVLAVLDVATTLHTMSKSESLALREVGVFASFFTKLGLIYLYIPLYVLCIICVAFILWFIKKNLNPEHSGDKVIFLLLVGAACYIYTIITAAFIVNLFLPTIIERGINIFHIEILVYGASIASLVFYIWSDVTAWIKTDREEHTEVKE